MSSANNFKEMQTKESFNQKPGFQDDGSFISPGYLPMSIPVEDIIPQESNPNAQNDKAFKALQTSILNTGYLFPVVITLNPLYDETLDPNDKPSLIGDEGRNVEVRDPEIRKYFKYSLVDGAHRLNAILVNKEIYDRENGTIPCAMIRDKTEQELMSCEILLNSSRGSHSLEGMREIVANLLESGMSPEWISRNLYLDPQEIERYRQLAGLASAYNDESEFSTDVWDPIKDRLAERRAGVKMAQRARAYVRAWRALANSEGGDFDIPHDIDIVAAAENIGFDKDNPYIVPTVVDPETGEIVETAMAKNLDDEE